MPDTAAHAREEMLREARRVFEIELAELQALRDRLHTPFAESVAVFKRCLEKGGKVVCLGVGKSGHIGEKIAATLTSTGCPAVVLNSLNALHGDIGVVSDGDVILVLSYSGGTEELLRVLPPLRTFDVTLVAMTGNPESALARNSDLVLDVAVTREACPLGLAPTSSTTLMLVLGDALAMTLLKARGFQRKDFARFHPAGSLGKALLTRVGDIMRPREHIALARPQDTVSQVLREMTRKRCGAAVVTADDATVAGVFSHGDFVRGYLSAEDIRDRAVSEFMTVNPVCINVNSLAAAVVGTLKDHKIDDLIVVDDNGSPRGLVDSQDFARLELL
jgi:arabinose-5-phosphate isomerase